MQAGANRFPPQSFGAAAVTATSSNTKVQRENNQTMGAISEKDAFMSVFQMEMKLLSGSNLKDRGAARHKIKTGSIGRMECGETQHATSENRQAAIHHVDRTENGDLMQRSVRSTTVHVSLMIDRQMDADNTVRLSCFFFAFFSLFYVRNLSYR